MSEHILPLKESEIFAALVKIITESKEKKTTRLQRGEWLWGTFVAIPLRNFFPPLLMLTAG